MIDKAYFDNMPSMNILEDYEPKDMTNEDLNNYAGDHLENMIINSNLESGNIIK